MKILRNVLIITECLVIVFLGFILLTSNEMNRNIIEKLGYRVSSDIKDNSIIAKSIDENLVVDTKDYILCDNPYEEEVINKSDNGIYKFKELTIDGVEAYMLIVYDAANVKMMVSPAFNTKDNSGKERIKAMTERYGALAGVNGGGFYDDGKTSKDIPMGYVIKDGEILWDYKNGRKGLIIGFSNDNKLMMLENVTGKEAVEQGMRDGLEFGPVLMREGVITEESKQPRWAGRASRVMLAQREDGIVIMLATNGGTVGGARMSKILEELQKYNVYNIANLDGGASAQMVVEGTLYTHVRSATGNFVQGGRLVVNGWGVFAPEKN